MMIQLSEREFVDYTRWLALRRNRKVGPRTPHAAASLVPDLPGACARVKRTAPNWGSQEWLYENCESCIDKS
jgi:hypothetical protein